LPCIIPGANSLALCDCSSEDFKCPGAKSDAPSSYFGPIADIERLFVIVANIIVTIALIITMDMIFFSLGKFFNFSMYWTLLPSL
jgi:hypothetical protein